MKRYFWLFLMALMAAGALFEARPAAASAPRARCFAETGYCISGPILTYWEQNGGLPTFGYPITDLHTETIEGWTGLVQWFERDRLEFHISEGVLAGRLGAQLLEFQGRSWQVFERVDKPPPGCRFFPETGHSLCGRFLQYWRENGGLERFGYPITEMFEETLPNWVGTVQYFERRRLEYHPENIGTQYDVLLGLLGRDLFDPYGCKEIVEVFRSTAAAYPDLLSCPSPFPSINVPIATQQFERGAMVWVQGLHGKSSAIFVVFFDNARNSLVWELYIDTWQAGEPERGGEAPPPGFFEPIRGFGKLWRTNEQVRYTLGWAVAPEVADRGSQQYFRGGAFMIHRASTDRIYLLYPDKRADDLPRIH